MTVLVATTPFRPLFFRPCFSPLPPSPTPSRIILSFYPVSLSPFTLLIPFSIEIYTYIYTCVRRKSVLERKFRYNITEIMRLSDEKSEIRFNLRSHKISMVYISSLRKISISTLCEQQFLLSIDFRVTHYIFDRLWDTFYLIPLEDIISY